jgi:hypothetical protein
VPARTPPRESADPHRGAAAPPVWITIRETTTADLEREASSSVVCRFGPGRPRDFPGLPAARSTESLGDGCRAESDPSGISIQQQRFHIAHWPCRGRCSTPGNFHRHGRTLEVPIARRRTAEPGELRTRPHALGQEAVSDVYLRLWPRRMHSTLTTTMRQAAGIFQVSWAPKSVSKPAVAGPSDVIGSA